MVVIGGIIGSGIFINPYIVAQRLDSSALVLAAWAAGGRDRARGRVCVCRARGAVSESGRAVCLPPRRVAPDARVPVRLGAPARDRERRDRGRRDYVRDVRAAPARPSATLAPAPLAIGAIVLLSIVNYLGVKPGSRVLNVFVVLKVAALAILIAAGALAPAAAGWWTAARDTAASSPTIVLFGAALVPILFAYGGWQNANYIAEEIDNPRRNLPLSLLVGTLTVIVIYVTVNVVYLRALGLEGLAATATPASTAAAIMFGSLGDRFVTAAIAVSTFGFLDLAILAPTRVYYAMAADRLLLPSLARLHPVYQTPWVAILVQSSWSCVLALTGRYEQLLNYVVFADWIFFGLTVATVIVFRRTHPLARRPARNVCGARVSAPADRVRRRGRRRRAERRPRRSLERASRRAAARGRRSSVPVVQAPLSVFHSGAGVVSGFSRPCTVRLQPGSCSVRLQPDSRRGPPEGGHYSSSNNASRIQPFHRPAVGRSRVRDAIVQPARTSVPEFDSRGLDAVPAPEGRAGDRLTVEPRFGRADFRLEACRAIRAPRSGLTPTRRSGFRAAGPRNTRRIPRRAAARPFLRCGSVPRSSANESRARHWD